MLELTVLYLAEPSAPPAASVQGTLHQWTSTLLVAVAMSAAMSAVLTAVALSARSVSSIGDDAALGRPKSGIEFRPLEGHECSENRLSRLISLHTWAEKLEMHWMPWMLKRKKWSWQLFKTPWKTTLTSCPTKNKLSYQELSASKVPYTCIN